MKLPAVFKSQAITKFTDPMCKFWVQHDADILTAVSISSGIATTGLMYKNSPEIHDIIAYYKEEIRRTKNPEKKKKLYLDAIRELNPLVTPLLILGTTSIVTSVASNRKQNKRIATISAGAAMTANALKEYEFFKEEAKKALGEEKVKDVEKKAAEKAAKEIVVENAEVGHAIKPLPGDKVYYDKWTGRQFSTNKKKIELAIRNLELQVRALADEDDDPVTLNDWYRLIGLEETEAGKVMGWNVSDRNSHFEYYIYSNSEDNGDDYDFVGVIDLWPHPILLERGWSPYHHY